MLSICAVYVDMCVAHTKICVVYAEICIVREAICGDLIVCVHCCSYERSMLSPVQGLE